MLADDLQTNVTVCGPDFPEPVQIIIAFPVGASIKLVGRGIRSNTIYEPILTADQVGLLSPLPESESTATDARNLPD